MARQARLCRGIQFRGCRPGPGGSLWLNGALVNAGWLAWVKLTAHAERMDIRGPGLLDINRASGVKKA